MKVHIEYQDHFGYWKHYQTLLTDDGRPCIGLRDGVQRSLVQERDGGAGGESEH